MDTARNIRSGARYFLMGFGFCVALVALFFLKDWLNYPHWNHWESKQYAQAGERINLNTARPKELRRLPGIGPVYADRIVQGRPYRNASDVIHRVPGFSADKWERIAPYAVLSDSDPVHEHGDKSAEPQRVFFRKPQR